MVCRNENDSEVPTVVAVDSVDGTLAPVEQMVADGVSLLTDGQHSGVGDAIRIGFSEAMERATVEDALTITPSVSATLVWPTDRMLLVRPSTQFAIGRSYYLTISDEARDRHANPLTAGLVVRFRLADDHLRLLRINLPDDRQLEQFATAMPLEIEPRNPLVNDYTLQLDFSRPFVRDDEKSAALRHITVRNLTRNGLPSVGRRGFNWIGDSSLTITYYDVAPSSAEVRNYLLLTLRGGPNGLRDSRGGYLERDIEQLFVVRRPTL